MFKESDAIQGLAQAYAARVAFQSCIEKLQSCEKELHTVLSDLITLAALDWIEKDLGWFLSQKIISAKMGRKVPENARAFCEKIAPNAIH